MKSGKLSVTNANLKNVAKKDRNDEKATVKIELSIDDPLSSVLSLLERRVRSLEKRKTKSVGLKQIANEGKTLNEDQLATVGQYDEIMMKLEFAKEMHENVVLMRTEFLKSKKGIPANFTDPVASARSDAVVCITTALDVLSNAQLYTEKLGIINSGNDSEPLSKSELNSVVKFKRLVDSSSKKIQFHYQNLVARSDKIINKELNLTYAALMDLINKIHHKVQVNSLSSKVENLKISETSSFEKQNGVHVEVKAEEKKNPVAIKPIEIIEIVENTESSDLWQDYSRTGDKKAKRANKPVRGTQQTPRTNQARSPRTDGNFRKDEVPRGLRDDRTFRGDEASRGRRDDRNLRGDETKRVSNGAPLITVRDNLPRARDENFRGYRGNRSYGRRGDDDGSRRVGENQGYAPREGAHNVGDSERPRSEFRKNEYKGEEGLRGRGRIPQERAPVVV